MQQSGLSLGMCAGLKPYETEEEEEKEALVLHLPTKPLLGCWRRPMAQM